MGLTERLKALEPWRIHKHDGHMDFVNRAAYERVKRIAILLAEKMDIFEQGCQNLLTLEQACVDDAYRKEAREAQAEALKILEDGNV